MKVGYNITVYGRVQGVGFRWSVQRKATETGLTGYVKNQPDGSVLIRVEGEEYQVGRLIEWCKRNPARSIVKSIDIEICNIKEYKRFDIKV